MGLFFIYYPSLLIHCRLITEVLDFVAQKTGMDCDPDSKMTPIGRRIALNKDVQWVFWFFHDNKQQDVLDERKQIRTTRKSFTRTTKDTRLHNAPT